VGGRWRTYVVQPTIQRLIIYIAMQRNAMSPPLLVVTALIQLTVGPYMPCRHSFFHGYVEKTHDHKEDLGCRRKSMLPSPSSCSSVFHPGLVLSSSTACLQGRVLTCEESCVGLDLHISVPCLDLPVRMLEGDTYPRLPNTDL
jgi:hypothetical protein